MTMTKKRILICIAVALAVVLIAGGIIAMTSNRETPISVPELLSLGEKYLLDLEHEQALAQFLKVIEIEPMNPRGYLGAAEAYIGLGQTDNAVEILEKGLLALPDSSEIKLRLEALLHPQIESEIQYESQIEQDEESSENLFQFPFISRSAFTYFSGEVRLNDRNESYYRYTLGEWNIDEMPKNIAESFWDSYILTWHFDSRGSHDEILELASYYQNQEIWKHENSWAPENQNTNVQHGFPIDDSGDGGRLTYLYMALTDKDINIIAICEVELPPLQ